METTFSYLQKLTSRTLTVLVIFIALLYGTRLPAQDTFSIVAIDSITGEVGSAGASCVGSSSSYPNGAQILSDVIPGVGAIHTQASWNATNQQRAHNWMVLGNSPQEIIDLLITNDAGNNPSIRQYGIVDYNSGHPRAAGYTGVNCMNYKNHMSHLNYSIQGNILLGQQILDSMESRFLNTPGTLADRLMAALQGAKVIGADTRCAVHNTSSQSAFLRVAKPQNNPDSLYLDIHMAYPQNLSGIYPVDPIDSLQVLYDEWKLFVNVKDKPGEFNPYLRVFSENTGTVTFDFTACRNSLGAETSVYDLTGRKVASFRVTSQVMKINLPAKGIFVYKVVKDSRQLAEGKVAI